MESASNLQLVDVRSAYDLWLPGWYGKCIYSLIGRCERCIQSYVDWLMVFITKFTLYIIIVVLTSIHRLKTIASSFWQRKRLRLEVRPVCRAFFSIKFSVFFGCLFLTLTIYHSKMTFLSAYFLFIFLLICFFPLALLLFLLVLVLLPFLFFLLLSCSSSSFFFFLPYSSCSSSFTCSPSCSCSTTNSISFSSLLTLFKECFSA